MSPTRNSHEMYVARKRITNRTTEFNIPCCCEDESKRSLCDPTDEFKRMIALMECVYRVDVLGPRTLRAIPALWKNPERLANGPGSRDLTKYVLASCRFVVSLCHGPCLICPRPPLANVSITLPPSYPNQFASRRCPFIFLSSYKILPR